MVELARHGVDQTTISFETIGQNEASVNLRDVLLNENLDYHFCVSSLSVPFDEFPIFPPSNAPIMRIIRRNVGVNIPGMIVLGQDNLSLEFNHAAFTLGGDKFRDVATLVERIQSWCQQFNEGQTVTGITQLGEYGGADNIETAILRTVAAVPREADGSLHPIHEYISAAINPEGLLQLTLSVNFCNHFVIQFSRYGIELLGLQQSTRPFLYDGWEYILAITTRNQTQSPLEDWVTLPPLLGAGDIEPGNNTRAQMILSRSNVYQLMDHRISINVQSHLPIANNIIITDGNEGLDNAISRTPVQAPLEIKQRFTKRIRASHEIRRRLFNGQVQLIKKSQSNFQWHRLLTSFQLKFIRLSLWASYRRYNPVTNTWYVKNDRLIIPEDRYWEATIRFISDT